MKEVRPSHSNQQSYWDSNLSVGVKPGVHQKPTREDRHFKVQEYTCQPACTENKRLLRMHNVGKYASQDEAAYGDHDPRCEPLGQALFAVRYFGIGSVTHPKRGIPRLEEMSNGPTLQANLRPSVECWLRTAIVAFAQNVKTPTLILLFSDGNVQPDGGVSPRKLGGGSKTLICEAFVLAFAIVEHVDETGILVVLRVAC
mmetsp:Transcript_67520/g.141125  ORF Transcript_67520/g.141125 Transcript_67520/m.141125 type:complete len:200 (-) Transcript_67520:505-1104(-)